jgi:hypothetical protein
MPGSWTLYLCLEKSTVVEGDWEYCGAVGGSVCDENAAKNKAGDDK